MGQHRDRLSPGTVAAPSARDLAASVLYRVHKDRAFAATALDAMLERHAQLDARERALATELVYGSLRTHGALMSVLRRYAPRGLPTRDLQTLMHLIVAAYQLLLLDRVPKYAAVDSAVRAVHAARGSRVAGFVNAVLRRLAAEAPRLQWEAAVLDSAPDWLRVRLEQAVGAEEAHVLVGASEGCRTRGAPSTWHTAQEPGAPAGEPDAPAGPEPGCTAVRVVAGAQLPKWLSQAAAGRTSPRARLVQGFGDLRRQPGWTEGVFTVQEEGSQVVALALGARRGERVLDACAGHGSKATLLAEQVGPRGELWVADLHFRKLRALHAEFDRLALPQPKSAAVDWTAGPGPIPDRFDRVLVDAPCSGTGTLRRRPELALRLLPHDPERLAGLSQSILRRAASRLRPGGRLIFAVCSVLPEEGEQVVEAVADVLLPVPFDAPELKAVIAEETVSLRLLPLRHGTDGYFVASLATRG